MSALERAATLLTATAATGGKYFELGPCVIRAEPANYQPDGCQPGPSSGPSLYGKLSPLALTKKPQQATCSSPTMVSFPLLLRKVQDWSVLFVAPARRPARLEAPKPFRLGTRIALIVVEETQEAPSGPGEIIARS